MALGLSLAILWILVAYNELAHSNFEFSESRPAKDASRHVTSLSKQNFIAESMNFAIELMILTAVISERCMAHKNGILLWSSPVME